MANDFTLDKYSELCKALIQSYHPLRVVDYFYGGKIEDRIAIIRHDVDKYQERSLKMARLENKLDIHSTYYFRMTDEFFIPEIIKEIEGMGHEIGFHYEVLDKADCEWDRELISQNVKNVGKKMLKRRNK